MPCLAAIFNDGFIACWIDRCRNMQSILSVRFSVSALSVAARQVRDQIPALRIDPLIDLLFGQTEGSST